MTKEIYGYILVYTGEADMKICHGCEGKGWVDSKFQGAVLCPICRGNGQIIENIESTIQTPQMPQLANKNSLLMDLEKWLLQQQSITFDHPSKTMNTYNFIGNISRRSMGLVWVSTNGAGRVYLSKGNYGSADGDKRVKYHNVWGNYPQFEIRTQADIDYAKILLSYALNNF